MAALKLTDTPQPTTLSLAQQVQQSRADARVAANEHIAQIVESMAVIAASCKDVDGYGDLVNPRVRDLIKRVGMDLEQRGREIKSFQERIAT